MNRVSENRFFKSRIVLFFMLGLFLVISVALLFFHEPWRDEAQAWLIARDAGGIPQILTIAHYEGSPILWHVLLSVLAIFKFPYFSMSILHLLIAFTAVIMFYWYAPFQRYQKMLFIFGYFILYEYTIIARNYALTVLLLFIAAVLYKKRFDNPGAYLTTIFLLANTNVHSYIISIILLFMYGYEYFIPKIEGDKKRRANVMAFGIVVGILLTLLIPLLQLLPAHDLHLGYARWNTDMSSVHFAVIPNAAFSAFIPVPQLRLDFWGTKLLFALSPFLVVLGLPLFLLSLLPLIYKKIPFLMYMASALALFTIFFFKLAGGMRHFGLLYIVWIFFLWIATYYPEDSFFTKRLNTFLDSRKNFIHSISSLFFVLILLIHIFASVVAISYEIRAPFSHAHDVAQFLMSDEDITDTIIATYQSSVASSILPYFSSDYRFYCLEYNDYCSFMVWNRDLSEANTETVIASLKIFEEIEPEKKHILILTDENYSVNLNITNKYKLLMVFDQSITHENYFIYEQKKVEQNVAEKTENNIS